MSQAEQLTLTIPVQDGQLQPSFVQKQAMSGYLQSRDGKAVKVVLSKPVTVRSNNQNRYLWGVVYEILAAETGHTAEEIHAVMKDKFLPRKHIIVGKQEVEVAKSTTELSSDEFELYLNRVRVFAETDMSIRIPLPNE